MSERLRKARRVVVKIGSALLVHQTSGALERTLLETLVADLAAMRGRGQDVLVVSSGAIALGRRSLGLPAGALRLEQAQAAAAVGQIRLAHAYQEAFKPHGITTAQILLTLWDTEERRRYLNARSTIGTLLRLGAVPVVNENDTVATAEIRYGDNDRLAARVAQMMAADLLVLLSDVDGLYTADPTRNASAQHVREVRALTPAIEAMASPAPSGAKERMGSGGMATKLAAAKIALNAGCHMVIASGRVPHPVRAIENGARCTWFVAQASPRAARKQWIAGSLKPQGALVLDDGAVRALLEGRSLLPAGVTNVQGTFERGDAVLLLDPTGREIGRGLCAYSSTDAHAIKGHKSREIEAILGYRGRDEMVQRDDLVLGEVVSAQAINTEIDR
jgi:glutamate 5-kinase